MAEFPQRETDLLRLGEKIASGFRNNPEVFPNPLVSPERLDERREEFFQAIRRASAARTEAKEATKHKREVLKQYKSELSDALRYAESATSSDNRKLALVGWGARRRGKKLQPPGQVADLDIDDEGRGWIKLIWAQPPKEVGKGRVTYYEVERTECGKDEWTHAGATQVTRIRLDNEERGIEWEYRVIAVNKQGRSIESNVVRAVL